MVGFVHRRKLHGTKEDSENRFVDSEEAEDKFATKEEMVKIVSFKDRNEVE